MAKENVLKHRIDGIYPQQANRPVMSVVKNWAVRPGLP